MDRLTEFKEWFINLNEATLDEIVYYYDENIFFKDPFNEFNGREKLKKLLTKCSPWIIKYKNCGVPFLSRGKI